MCSDGLNFAAHNAYVDDSSFVDLGADFAASRINASSPPPEGGDTGQQDLSDRTR